MDNAESKFRKSS